MHTVGQTVRQLHNRGMSILFVEQKLTFALKYGDFIHIMGKGKIVFSSSPDELEENDEVRDRYLGI